MVQCKSLPCRSESSSCFTASFSFAGLSRCRVYGESLCCKQVVLLGHSESLRRKPESLFLFNANRFFACRNRLLFSLRISPSLVGLVILIHTEYLLRRSESFFCFTPNLEFASRNVSSVSRRIVSSQVGIVLLFHGKSLLRRSGSLFWFMTNF